MVSAFLDRKLCIGLVLDEVTEDRLLSLELSRLVLGIYPVEDVLLLVLSLPCNQ
jgi:hypothetical protein